MSGRRSGWSVRAHLAAIAAAVVVASLVLGTFAAVHTWRDGEQDVQANARYLADVVARAVASSLAVGQAQAVNLAGNPQIVGVIAAPVDCQLSFELDPFPESHLDVVQLGGEVACSTMATDGRDGSHTGLAWVEGLATATDPFSIETFIDGATGRSAIGFAAPVADGSGTVVGAVVLVLPTDGIAGRLEATFAGPQGFDFALVDTATGSTVSRSDEAFPDQSGEGYLSGSAPVPGAGWDVVAAVPTSEALAAVRATLLRGSLVGVGMVIVLLLALVVVSRRIGRPLLLLNTAVGHEGPGAGQALATIRGPREIERLADEFSAALAAHADFEAQLSHQALHDPLTGLPNRALLADRLALALRHAERNGSQVCVIFLDLDHFKLVNDGLGHGMGDLVLMATAERLTSVLRSSDTIARFGGDEFVILGEAADQLDAERLAGRLLDAVQAPIEIGETVVRVTASAGMAMGGGASDGAALIRDADAAMYLAKDRGRSRTEAFNEDLRDRARTRLTVETELRVALERGELRVDYQPKVDLITSDHVGVEALVRWDHPGLGAVGPATFIPIAEETGLIGPIGRFVLEQACHQTARWQADGLLVDVAVNVSGHQLTDPTFLDHLRRALADSGLEPHRLCLELTESVLMRDTAGTAMVLDAVHDLGVQLSIDDFGTGYSSLAYLDQFRVDELKIDRSFVHNIVNAPRQRSLVTAMIAMGKALDLRTVAEGVETEEQAELLRLLGCDQAQGYYFARPQSAATLETQLRRRLPASS